LLVIAAQPANVSRLRADIMRLGLADRITLLGAVAAEQVAPLYVSADLFVLPSRFEATDGLHRGHRPWRAGHRTTAGAIPQTVPADAACSWRPTMSRRS